LPIHTRSVVGRGSVFSVTVPLGTKPAAAARRPAIDRIAASLSDAVVMVIDDQYSILAGMQALLAGWGCLVLLAASGTEALDMLPHLPRPLDVVIADYHLDAGSTGIIEIGRIREAASRPVPGILITADHSVEVQDQVKRHGYWLLRKPLNPAQLRALLTTLLT
jgi:CheY-like chemotaxis protein